MVHECRLWSPQHYYKQYTERTQRKLDDFDLDYRDIIEARKTYMDQVCSDNNMSNNIDVAEIRILML